MGLTRGEPGLDCHSIVTQSFAHTAPRLHRRTLCSESLLVSSLKSFTKSRKASAELLHGESDPPVGSAHALRHRPRDLAAIPEKAREVGSSPCAPWKHPRARLGARPSQNGPSQAELTRRRRSSPRRWAAEVRALQESFWLSDTCLWTLQGPLAEALREAGAENP